ncbi:MAG: 50S ribosomal protein L15 [Candidatus Nitrosocaldaceae archaeon]|nr:MAG: 50S ribosomal protein L15 [Candidatus Nitrosocaldaceae archaeon]
MATRNRKVRKLRGSRTHGWGQVAQHRSSGHKGGVGGKVGLRKHHWTIAVLFRDKYNPKGFNPPRRNKTKSWVNVNALDDIFFKYGREEDGKKIINLNELGYEKLLGSGNVKGSYSIIVSSASENAKSKVENAGGEVILV